MTKEELKNAISETIYSNGKKGISGDSLANLLIDIVDAAGEGGGSGSNVLVFNMKLDPETYEIITTPSDENLQFRQTLIEGINNNKSYGVLVNMCTDMTYVLEALGTSGKFIMCEFVVASYTYINVPEKGEQLALAMYDISDPTVVIEIVINSDGSITIEEPEESTTE